MENQTIDPKVVALTSHVGEFIDYWGFKAIEGKIWSLTYISDRPLGPSDYIQAFDISKGLVSQCVKRLVEYDVLIEVSEAGKKKQFYRANDDLVNVIKGVLRVRERRMLEQVEKSAKSLEKVGSKKLEKLEVDIDKVKKVGELTQAAKVLLEMMVNNDNSPI